MQVRFERIQRDRPTFLTWLWLHDFVQIPWCRRAGLVGTGLPGLGIVQTLADVVSDTVLAMHNSVLYIIVSFYASCAIFMQSG